MWDKILKFINDNKDSLNLLFGSGVGITLLSLTWKLFNSFAKRVRATKAGVNTFPFEVIPPNSNIAQFVLTNRTSDVLADRNIPYQPRTRKRNISRELAELLQENRWVLILGKTGTGKTREAIQVLQGLSNEGWTILYLKRAEWLDAPSKFPENKIGTDRKIIIFLDDLNRKIYAGRTEKTPNANDPFQPLIVPLQDRLRNTLEAYESMCGKGEIRVVATARDEMTTEYPGEPSEWEKLETNKYPNFWENFSFFQLPDPDDDAIISLLSAITEKAQISANPEIFPLIAQKNDGTFANIIANLISIRNEGEILTTEIFSDTLRGTWEKRYKHVHENYPFAMYVYHAAYIMRQMGIEDLSPFIYEIAKLLLPGRTNLVLTPYRLRKTINYLLKAENIATPRDGQLEVAGHPPTITPYLFKLALYKTHSEVFTSIFPDNVTDIKKKYRTLVSRLRYVLPTLRSYPRALFKRRKVYEFIVFTKILYIRLEMHKRTPWLVRLRKGESRSLYYVYISRLYEYINYPSFAIDTIEKAIELEPKDPNHWDRLGDHYRQLGQYTEAVFAYRQATELKPNKSTFWNSLGNSYSDLNLLDNAIIAYLNAIKLSSESIYWNNLGINYIKAGNVEQAIQAFNKALEIDAYDVYSNISLATCSQMLGDNAQKDFYIQKAASLLKTNRFMGNYHRACYEALNGNSEDAIDLLSKSIRKERAPMTWARHDPNFASLFKNKRFQLLVGVDDEIGLIG